MHRALLRFPFQALLAGLTLTACGGTTEEFGLAQAGEDVGVQESAVCAGATVSSLTLTGVSSYGGELAGSGGWTVTYPANAVYLEYYVDGAWTASQRVTGSSGTWNFSKQGMTCGSHTFEVRVFPRVVDSAGGESICGPGPSKTLTQTVIQECPTASLGCSSSNNYVNCIGSGSGGTGGYTYFWQERYVYPDGTMYTSPWEQGTTTNAYYCELPRYRDQSIGIGRYFKVRDSSGMESPARGSTRLCRY